MLSIRGSSVQPPRSAGRASAARRVLAPLRAANGGIGEALNSVANAFVKIFSPPQDDAPNGNWEGTTSNFSGRIRHHGPGRPFKDGFSGPKAAAAPGAEAAPAATAPAAEEAGNEPQAAGYVEGAVKSVMDKNFAGKDDKRTVYTAAFNSHNCIRFATAMIVPQLGTGAEGWKGDLHGRKRDGFHIPRS
ncbi:hypothetical protein MNEG_5224 [Monoraphidium neglectum]|uniref:Uncharacterized protein n=1 Tax=Monoraphidium neglectum TaxID=145388 RepID=A0A0D2MQN4_9CHLO|nr:hypothetical protein MNEG_5224 [Monoraphidium neglectum]KIZ02737.1 hypothetical protein MNEG_5224 [Monoraphidium neglectum]|eukprot:XP_013901756.1 hypothetical protein MNEG_5224 [Monoraphidium neglectum]